MRGLIHNYERHDETYKQNSFRINFTMLKYFYSNIYTNTLCFI